MRDFHKETWVEIKEGIGLSIKIFLATILAFSIIGATFFALFYAG